MKPIDVKNKTLWGVCMTGLLAVSYWLCRFVFYGMHGMKDWPNMLAMVGLIIIVIASIVGKRILAVATVVGYMGGFVLAMIFHTHGVDQGGGGTNNAWIIWGCVFILSIIVGLFMDKGSRVIGFVSTLTVLCGLVTTLFNEIFKQFTVTVILVPTTIILGLALILGYIREKPEKIK